MGITFSEVFVDEFFISKKELFKLRYEIIKAVRNDKPRFGNNMKKEYTRCWLLIHLCCICKKISYISNQRAKVQFIFTASKMDTTCLYKPMINLIDASFHLVLSNYMYQNNIFSICSLHFFSCIRHARFLFAKHTFEHPSNKIYHQFRSPCGSRV